MIPASVNNAAIHALSRQHQTDSDYVSERSSKLSMSQIGKIGLLRQPTYMSHSSAQILSNNSNKIEENDGGDIDISPQKSFNVDTVNANLSKSNTIPLMQDLIEVDGIDIDEFGDIPISTFGQIEKQIGNANIDKKSRKNVSATKSMGSYSKSKIGSMFVEEQNVYYEGFRDFLTQMIWPFFL